jgi:hypothetical protein
MRPAGGASVKEASNPVALTGTGIYSTLLVPSGMGVSSMTVCRGMLRLGISS